MSNRSKKRDNKILDCLPKNRYGEPDYLDEDPPIAGQQYILLSFATMLPDMKKELFRKLALKHHMTTGKIEQVISDYESEENPKRAFKVRGAGDMEFLKRKQQELVELDEFFHIMLGEMGKWSPFAQKIDTIENQEYSERQLNDLVRGHKESVLQSRAHYQQRTNELMNKAIQEGTREGQADLSATEESIQSIDAKLQAHKTHIARLLQELEKLRNEEKELQEDYEKARAKNPDFIPIDPEANPVITKEYNLPACTEITDVSNEVPAHMKRPAREDMLAELQANIPTRNKY